MSGPRGRVGAVVNRSEDGLLDFVLAESLDELRGARPSCVPELHSAVGPAGNDAMFVLGVAVEGVERACATVPVRFDNML